jgi:3-oxoacyl-[acyl-carrier-protein] synthase III
VALTIVEGVSIRAIAAAVPATVRANADIGEEANREYVQKMSAAVGVRERRVVQPGQFGSHLAGVACESLLGRLDWPAASIDLLIVATQTPDRLFPGIAFDLHRRLGLRQGCPVFDINLGCSAFTHGLWTTASLLRSVGTRALLINVDTMSRTLDVSDWGNQVLFGDAGTATALELDSGASPMYVSLASDGKGTESVCFPKSGMSAVESHRPAFVINGPAVLGLALRSVPKIVDELLRSATLAIDEIGAFAPHQANVFILDKLIERLGIDRARALISMELLGNTSSASIPLAFCALAEDAERLDRRNTMMVGFGTGFSLSGVIADLSSTIFVAPVDVG